MIQSWICVGLAWWLLGDPGRLWPWFVLGWACFASLAVALLEPQTGTPVSSLAYAAIVGGPLASAGWHVQSLGYTALGWICYAIAPIFVLFAVGQGIYMLATLRKPD